MLMTRNAIMDVSLQATSFDEAAKHVKSILEMEHEASVLALLNGATWLFQLVGLVLQLPLLQLAIWW